MNIKEIYRQLPKNGEVWRHFKGKDYIIREANCLHTESDEYLVIYQALYYPFKVFARPLSNFMDRIDKDKYPEQYKQMYRFIKYADSVDKYVI